MIDEIRRILALPMDPALLQTLAIEAAPRHTAYRVESFVDALPDVRAEHHQRRQQGQQRVDQAAHSGQSRDHLIGGGIRV